MRRTPACEKLPCGAVAAARTKPVGRLAQLVRAPALQAGGHWFKSSTAHHVSAPIDRPSPYRTRAWHCRPGSADVRIELVGGGDVGGREHARHEVAQHVHGVGEVRRPLDQAQRIRTLLAGVLADAADPGDKPRRLILLASGLSAGMAGHPRISSVRSSSSMSDALASISRRSASPSGAERGEKPYGSMTAAQSGQGQIPGASDVGRQLRARHCGQARGAQEFASTHRTLRRAHYSSSRRRRATASSEPIRHNGFSLALGTGRCQSSQRTEDGGSRPLVFPQGCNYCKRRIFRSAGAPEFAEAYSAQPETEFRNPRFFLPEAIVELRLAHC